MKKLVLAVFASILSISFVYSQEESKDTSWTKGGLITLNFSQVSLSNWASGGQNSIATNGLLNIYANKKKEKSSWDNTLDLGYGLLKQGKADFFKSDDKIELTSKYGRQANKNWYYSALLSLRTQFTKGYNTLEDTTYLSAFFAPGYILTAIGMDYKPNDKLAILIAPITSKMTIVNDDSLSSVGAFGVDPGKKFRGEFGGYLKLSYQTQLMENVTFQTKLDLFTNYIDDPSKIDVNWETLISLKVNKFITASIATHLIYDEDIVIFEDGEALGPRVQFKEVLGIGFAYQF